MAWLEHVQEHPLLILEQTLLLDAIRMEWLAYFPVETLFPHILSLPVICPLCSAGWMILLNLPMALDVELGLDGATHLNLLQEGIFFDCEGGHDSRHFRTDGTRVWKVIPRQSASHPSLKRLN